MTQANLQAPKLQALADMLVRQRLATLSNVWSLSLTEVRTAIRLLQPPSKQAAPSAHDLHALMQAFPDKSLEKTHHDQ